MIIKLRKVLIPLHDDVAYELMPGATQMEQYMLRHCLTPFLPGSVPGLPYIMGEHLNTALILLEAHNVELEISEG